MAWKIVENRGNRNLNRLSVLSNVENRGIQNLGFLDFFSVHASQAEMSAASPTSDGFKTPLKSILRRADSQDTVGSVGSERKVSFSPSLLEQLIANEGLEAALEKLKQLHALKQAVRHGQLALPDAKPALHRKNARDLLHGSPVPADVKEEPESDHESCEEEMLSDLDAFLNHSEVEDTPGWKEDLDAFLWQRDTVHRPAGDQSAAKATERKPEARVVKRTIIPKNCHVKIVQRKVNIFDPQTWGGCGKPRCLPSGKEVPCGSRQENVSCDQAAREVRAADDDQAGRQCLISFFVGCDASRPLGTRSAQHAKRRQLRFKNQKSQ